LIASRKRTGLVLDYLREKGFQQADIDRVRAPAGIALGARTAEEIALSVISEMVLVRRSRARQAAGDAAAPAGEKRPAAALSVVGQRTVRAAGG
ncbi:MAG: XdhC family protein, partial [Acetobacteraceae bacterium]|nr:XdhC family protein [Acetobacteraceae bacterium]